MDIIEAYHQSKFLRLRTDSKKPRDKWSLEQHKYSYNQQQSLSWKSWAILPTNNQYFIVDNDGIPGLLETLGLKANFTKVKNGRIHEHAYCYDPSLTPDSPLWNSKFLYKDKDESLSYIEGNKIKNVGVDVLAGSGYVRFNPEDYEKVSDELNVVSGDKIKEYLDSNYRKINRKSYKKLVDKQAMRRVYDSLVETFLNTVIRRNFDNENKPSTHLSMDQETKEVIGIIEYGSSMQKFLDSVTRINPDYKFKGPTQVSGGIFLHRFDMVHMLQDSKLREYIYSLGFEDQFDAEIKPLSPLMQDTIEHISPVDYERLSTEPYRISNSHQCLSYVIEDTSDLDLSVLYSVYCGIYNKVHGEVPQVIQRLLQFFIQHTNIKISFKELVSKLYYTDNYESNRRDLWTHISRLLQLGFLQSGTNLLNDATEVITKDKRAHTYRLSHSTETHTLLRVPVLKIGLSNISKVSKENKNMYNEFKVAEEVRTPVTRVGYLKVERYLSNKENITIGEFLTYLAYKLRVDRVELIEDLHKYLGQSQSDVLLLKMYRNFQQDQNYNLLKLISYIESKKSQRKTI